ncbi:hypothetical protein T10_4464 [Trichinella papuae]|uniref:Uncharacterized protein n=1 Tax=Trichinella papuae TaxID=268474 RepID=A0A0V1MMY9_9BILA|nr:hypothetical protein T10_4464 [Trichinella papuae]
MADVFDLRLVLHHCCGISGVYENTAKKLKYARCNCGDVPKYVMNVLNVFLDKQGCDGAISTSLELTVVLKQRPHMETWPVDERVAYIMEKKAILKKRCAEETKSIRSIYDEEAATASTEQSTSEHFPAFKPDRNSVYNLQLKSIPFVMNKQARTLSNWQKQMFITLTMADDFELRLENQGCEGAISTNSEVTVLLRQRPRMETWPVDEHVAYIMEKKAILKKRCAEETKSIPVIYDEGHAAASTEPSTSGHCPAFKRFRNAMYNNSLLTCILKRCKQARTLSDWRNNCSLFSSWLIPLSCVL